MPRLLPAKATAVGLNGKVQYTPPTDFIGTATISYTIDDGRTGTATATITVTVTAPPDSTPPTISGTFSPLTLTTGAGGTATVPNYTTQATTGDNVGVTSVTQSPAAGSTLSPGTTTITVTAHDAAGNTASTSFSVTVNDGTAPALNLPANMTVEATSAAGAVVTFSATATDNVGTPTVAANPASGSTFAIGTTTVHVTASDGSANTTSGSFTVTVRDTTGPTMQAPVGGFTPLTLATDASGFATLPNYTTQVTASDSGGTVTMTQSPTAGGATGPGTVRVTITATDSAGNTTTTSFDVTVLDGTAPTVVGPLGGFTPLTLNTDNTGKATVPDYTTQASATDNVGVVGDITQSPAAGTLKPAGEVTVTLSAADDAGNVGTFTLILNINDGTKPTITTLPADRTIAAGSEGTAATPDLASEVVASDNVGIASIAQDPAAGTALAVGTHDVTITVRDAAGNTASGIVHLTVSDQSLPVVSAPTDGFTPLSLTTGTNGLATIPNYATQATASDNIDTTLEITQSPAAGSTIGAGTVLVTLRTVDSAGNVGTLSFSVVIADGTAPSVSGTFSPLTVATGAGGTATLADYTSQLVTSDNVAVTSIVQSPTAGTALAIGTTRVTLTAYDAAGNATSTSFDVTVNDGTAPTISGTFTPLTLLAPTTLPDYKSQATVTDNSGSATLTQSPAAGSEVATDGSVSVTLTARDGAGNEATRSFTVWVSAPVAVTYADLATFSDHLPTAADDPRIVDGAIWKAFKVPAINDAAKMAFIAKWATGDVRGTGIFAGEPAALVCGLNEAAPSADGAVFASFYDPVLNRGGEDTEAVAFLATLGRPAKAKLPVINAGNNIGLWSNLGSELQLVARKGNAAPQIEGATFGSFGSVSMVEDEVLFTSYVLNAPGVAVRRVNASNDMCLWRWRPESGTDLILREGQTITMNGVSRVVSTFQMLGTVAGTAGHGRHHLAAGIYAARVFFYNRTVADCLIDARGETPTFLLLARTGQALFNGLTAGTVGVPAANATGEAAFLESFWITQRGPTVKDNVAVIASRGGHWELVARKGAMVTDTAKWATFNDPMINDAGHVAWTGTLTDSTGGGSSVVAWSRAGRPVEIVARAFTEAPDTNGAQFASFITTALTEDGPLFVASLVTKTQTNPPTSPGPGGATCGDDLGIWGVGPGGQLRLLLREGQVIGDKKVATFSLLANVPGSAGQTRSFNRNHEVIVNVIFCDSTQKLVKIVLH